MIFSIELLRGIHLSAVRIDDHLNALFEANSVTIDVLFLHHAHEV